MRTPAGEVGDTTRVKVQPAAGRFSIGDRLSDTLIRSSCHLRKRPSRCDAAMRAGLCEASRNPAFWHVLRNRLGPQVFSALGDVMALSGFIHPDPHDPI